MKKKIYPLTKFVVRREIYLHINKKFEDGIINIEPSYKLWEAVFGAGNKPFLILTNHIKELDLGDNKACLKVLQPDEAFRYLTEKGITKEILEKLCNTFKVKIEKENDEMNLTKTLLSFVESVEIYRPTLPISDDYLQELLKNPEKLQNEIIFYLDENCEKDSKMLFWAKTCLVKISDNLEDYKLEKFRGHAFIVKNPKTGFSTFALKSGKVVDYSTAASVRGYCDSQGNVKHGTFHGQNILILFLTSQQLPWKMEFNLLKVLQEK